MDDRNHSKPDLGGCEDHEVSLDRAGHISTYRQQNKLKHACFFMRED